MPPTTTTTPPRIGGSSIAFLDSAEDVRDLADQLVHEKLRDPGYLVGDVKIDAE